jgi:hypothetical protein
MIIKYPLYNYFVFTSSCRSKFIQNKKILTVEQKCLEHGNSGYFIFK